MSVCGRTREGEREGRIEVRVRSVPLGGWRYPRPMRNREREFFDFEKIFPISFYFVHNDLMRFFFTTLFFSHGRPFSSLSPLHDTPYEKMMKDEMNTT